MSAFFNQAILEHQLSRYATRMIAMYQASEKAKERKRKLEIEKKKLERQLFNKKQIELFSGFNYGVRLHSFNSRRSG
jgi:F0F1-type ATP synthase gamma subunit